MKYSKLFSGTLAVLLGIMLLAFGTAGVFAYDDDESTVIDEPATAEYVEPETEDIEPETEYITPETEYAEPETEYVEPETEAPQPETEQPQETVPQETQEYVNNIDDENTGTTEFFVPPTVPKTVSQKTYSTNYVFGITSWICTAVGVIVILAVLISTKAGGRRNNQGL